MGNRNTSIGGISDETKELIVQQTGMSKYDLELWYKAILDRSTKGKLSRNQMISVYKDMSDLDPARITEVVHLIEKVFDEDHSGHVDIEEFLRGFILTTKGDLRSKIDYTFRIYDQNADNQISGDEIQKMANMITRMLGGNVEGNDQACDAIIQQFLKQFTRTNNGVIYKHDFINIIMRNQELLALLSPFYACSIHRQI